MSYQKWREYDKAIESYTSAIEIKPKKAAYVKACAVCYEDKLNYDQALNDWTSAIGIEPNNALDSNANLVSSSPACSDPIRVRQLKFGKSQIRETPNKNIENSGVSENCQSLLGALLYDMLDNVCRPE
jgi:tetratricopeptide (TPR) repeat protein